MALQTSATINGVHHDSLYFSVVQSRKQKLYMKDENGNDLPPEYKTWVYVQAFADAQAKRNGGAMLGKNQLICLDGDVVSADVDSMLKQHKIQRYRGDFVVLDVDFANATIV